MFAYQTDLSIVRSSQIQQLIFIYEDEMNHTTCNTLILKMVNMNIVSHFLFLIDTTDIAI